MFLNWLQIATKKTFLKTITGQLSYFKNDNTLSGSVVFYLRTFKYFSNIDSSIHDTLRYWVNNSAFIHFQRFTVSKDMWTLFFPFFFPFLSSFFKSFCPVFLFLSIFFVVAMEGHQIYSLIATR